MQAALAQIFTDTGEGLIVRGNSFAWDMERKESLVLLANRPSIYYRKQFRSTRNTTTIKPLTASLFTRNPDSEERKPRGFKKHCQMSQSMISCPSHLILEISSSTGTATTRFLEELRQSYPTDHILSTVSASSNISIHTLTRGSRDLSKYQSTMVTHHSRNLPGSLSPLRD